MSKRLKHHTVADLEWDIRQWGFEYDLGTISEKYYNIETGKLKAELTRREKAKTLTTETNAA